MKKIPVVLMIGALNSNFMQDSLSMVANSAIRLNEIYKRKKFKLRIVGKSKPPINIRKNSIFLGLNLLDGLKAQKKSTKMRHIYFVRILFQQDQEQNYWNQHLQKFA